MLAKVIFCVQDPGGCNFLIPVIEKIKKEPRFEILVIAGSYSKELLRNKGIEYISYNEKEEELKRDIASFNPNLICTSTSRGFSLEKKVIRLMKGKVPLISVIDYWSNYWLRFINPREEKDDFYLSDKIGVIDEFMLKEMLAEKFPEDKLVVIGNPAFDCLESIKINIKSNRENNSDGDTKNSNTEKRCVLFISQPLKTIYTSEEYLHRGYDEYIVLKDLINVMIATNHNKLTIKTHPKEEKNKFNEIIKKYNYLIKIDLEEESLTDSLKKAGIVVGMNSMALFEAALTGKKVISYQPNLISGGDTLISNKLGLSTLITQKEDLLKELSKGLIESNNYNIEKANKYIHQNAAGKIIHLITQVIENSSQ